MVKLSALAFGLLTVVAQVSAQQTVKVMPFGASIVSKCWRANLQTKLRADGVTNFDFVGTQKSSCGGTNIDQDHEGHPGSQATEYAAKGNLTVWLNAVDKPDVILMLLGTNDVLLGKKPAGEILKAYDVLIGQMRDRNPKMRILFSNLLPLDKARWPAAGADGIEQLNTAIRQWTPSKSTRDSPVVFVDNFTGFDAVADTTDGEHPNESGNEKMATQFFAPTRDAIKAISGTDPVPQGQPKAEEQELAPTATPTPTPTPTPAVSSVESISQAPSASSTQSSIRVQSSVQAQSALKAQNTSAQSSATPASSLVSVTVQFQTTAVPTPIAKTTTTTTQGSQQTSAANSLKAPWPLGMWRSLRWAMSIEVSRQSVLSG